MRTLLSRKWSHLSLSLSEVCVLMLFPMGGLAQGVLLSERVVSAQAHRSSVETVRQITGLDGQPALVTNRYVVLATGLNRQDPRTGRWIRAHDTIWMLYAPGPCCP